MYSKQIYTEEENFTLFMLGLRVQSPRLVWSVTTRLSKHTEQVFPFRKLTQRKSQYQMIQVNENIEPIAKNF